MLLYIHVPFCRKKCSYCAFYSCVASQGSLGKYTAFVCKEARYWGKKLGHPRVDTLYLGGGTPSLLSADQIHFLLSAVKENFVLRPGMECTMEANPDSMLDMKYLRAIQKAGVNRLSIGIQSLYDNSLLTLGRCHLSRQAVYAVNLARACGFSNISVDLIWGLPKQRLYAWMQTLRSIVAMNPDHISCYGLTLEPGTPLEKLSQKVELELPDEEELAKMFVTGTRFLESEGYLQYEISNFARMGYACKHNKGYWAGAPYLGLGPGAVSTIKRHRWTNAPLQQWMQAVSVGSLGQNYEELAKKDVINELVMLGLRTTEGLHLNTYKKQTQKDFTKQFESKLTALRQQGLIRIHDGYIRLSKAGMLVADTIISHFFI